jgi:hypothetical protein
LWIKILLLLLLLAANDVTPKFIIVETVTCTSNDVRRFHGQTHAAALWWTCTHYYSWTSLMNINHFSSE